MNRRRVAVSTAVAAVSIVVALIVGLIIGALFLGAVLGPAVAPRAPAAAEKLVIGVTDKVSDLDPSNAYDFFTWEVLSNVMSGLLRYAPGTTDLEYGIATSYTVSEDGLEYTFKLRPNLYFADGTPATADDVVRSIKRVMKINGDPAWLVTDFVKDVVAVDDHTVKFILKKPVAYFPALVAVPPYFPVHPKYKPDEIDSDQTAGGLGPYKIVKWERDVELILEANPYYWGGAPKVKRIVIKFFKTASALRLALEAGEIDVAWRTLTPTDIQDLKSKPEVKVTEVPGAYIRYIILNTKIPPFDNPLVRKALAAAVDRKGICEKVFLGTVEPLYSMIPIGMWSHKDSFLEKYGEKNLDLAKKLLKQAGYSETNKLKIELWYTPTHYGDTEVDVAQMIKQAWEETGVIEVTLKSAEWTTYLEQTRKGVLGATLYGWYPDYIDPDDYTSPWVNTSWTGYAYSNPELLKILDEASVRTSIAERTKLYEQAQDIWADDAAVIPLFQGKLFVVSKPEVQGIVMDPTMLFRYWLLSKT